MFTTAVNILVPTSGADYSATILADSPIRYYKLDELSGTVAVSAVGGGNGTYNATISVLGAAPLINTGASLQCSTVTNAAVTCTVSAGEAGLRFTTGNFGMELWVNTTSSTDSGVLTKAREVIDFPSWCLRYVGSTKKVEFSVRTANAAGVAFTLTSASIIGDGTDKHLFVRRNGDVHDLFVNGVIEATVTSTARPWASPNSVGIGCYQILGENAKNLIGRVDECAFYSTALSDARIMAHYLAGI